MKRYFPNEMEDVSRGYSLDVRAQIALDLMRTSSILLGKPDGEDSSGRQKLGLMQETEVAWRALSIAEVFVKLCEERNYLSVPSMTVDRAAAELGRLDRIKSRAHWDQDEKAAKAANAMVKKGRDRLEAEEEKDAAARL